MRKFTGKGLSLILAATMILGIAAVPAEAKNQRPVQPGYNQNRFQDMEDEAFQEYLADYLESDEGDGLQTGDELQYNETAQDTDEEDGEDFHQEIIEPLTLKTKKLTVTAGKRAKIVITGGESDIKLKYQSSNKRIATVTSKGTVKGKRAGKATITIRTSDGQIAKVKVTVKAAKKTTAKKAATKKTTTKKTSTKKTTASGSSETSSKTADITDTDSETDAAEQSAGTSAAVQDNAADETNGSEQNDSTSTAAQDDAASEAAADNVITDADTAAL